MKKNITRIQAIVHLLSWSPIIVLAWNLINNHLGANPIQTITLRTGRSALNLLFLTLSCTPLHNLGVASALLVRRPLGLYTFLYALLHFLTFAILDFGFQIAEIAYLISHQLFLFFGILALILLMVLAFTSTSYWVKRMGVMWKRIHRLVYVIVIIVIVHFFLAVKLDTRIPILYLVFFLILMILRIPLLKRKNAIPKTIKKLDRFFSTYCFK